MAVPRLSLDTRKQIDAKIGSPMSQSSLAISTFSTPEVGTRDLREPKDPSSAVTPDAASAPVVMAKAKERCRQRSANSMVMAKLDISDFFAPLEARFAAQLAEVEAKLDLRCDDLERRLDAVRPISPPSGGSGGLSEGEQARVQDLETLIADLGQRQASMEECILELRQQTKRDRQESFDKFQGFSDALESRLRRLYDNVEAALCPQTAETSMESSVESSTGGTGVARWRSSPSPMLLLSRNRSPASLSSLDGMKPMHAEDDDVLVLTSGLAEESGVHRWCSVPSSAMPPRGDRSPQVPGGHGSNSPECCASPPAGSRPATPQPHQQQRTVIAGQGPSMRSPISQQRAAPHASPNLGVRTMGGSAALGGTVPPWGTSVQTAARGPQPTSTAAAGAAQQQQRIQQQQPAMPQRLQQQTPLRSSGSTPGLQRATHL